MISIARKAYSETAKTFPKRILGLDIIRSFAILLVLIEHAGLNPYKHLHIGGFGVEVFFVLSGFLIGGILIRDFNDLNGFSTIANFWKRRWFRTLPLYYLALIYKIVVSSEWDWGYLFYFFFLQNNFFGISLFPVSWSLVVEEWFYLGLPLLFLMGVWVFKRLKPQFVVGAILMLILFKLGFVLWRDTPLDGVSGNPLLRADTMLIGVLLAIVKKQYPLWFSCLSHWMFFGLGILMFLILIMLQAYSSSSLDSSLFFRVCYHPILSLSVAVTIPFLSLNTWVNEGLNKYKLITLPIIWTSILSYSFYLFHLDVFRFVARYYSSHMQFGVQIIALFIVGFAVYVLYEKPITDLRDQRNHA